MMVCRYFLLSYLNKRVYETSKASETVQNRYNGAGDEFVDSAEVFELYHDPAISKRLEEKENHTMSKFCSLFILEK